MLLSDLQELSLSTILTSAALLLLTVVYVLHKYRGVFPGPTGVPYLGLLPFLKYETCHLQLANYGKEYGDIYSFTFTGRLFIHLGSVKAVRDLHINKSECFVDRFSTFNVLTYMLQDGVVMANGEMWKTQRKFFIQKFREYGLHSFQEGPIYDSLDETLKLLKESTGRSVNIFQLLTERCTATLRRILFGENGISDNDIATLNTTYASSLDGMFGTSMLVMGPVGRLLFSIYPTARKALKSHDKMRNILNACIKKIESNMKEDQTTCIIEDYFKERNGKRRQNDPTWKLYTDTSLVSSLAQFVGDGIGGVAGFIVGILNALIEHPEGQEKIYQEIIEVVGTSRSLTLADKARLPYTNAFFNEALRTSAFLSLMPSLECTKETTYRGYRIPKGAITLYNFWAIHHNPDTFEDPDTFNPSRYLPGPGKTKEELPTTFGMAFYVSRKMTQLKISILYPHLNQDAYLLPFHTNSFDKFLAKKVEPVPCTVRNKPLVICLVKKPNHNGTFREWFYKYVEATRRLLGHAMPNTESQYVPNSECVQNSGKVPNSEYVQNSGKVPKSEYVQNSGKVPKSESEKVTNSEYVPKENCFFNFSNFLNSDMYMNLVPEMNPVNPVPANPMPANSMPEMPVSLNNPILFDTPHLKFEDEETVLNISSFSDNFTNLRNEISNILKNEEDKFKHIPQKMTVIIDRNNYEYVLNM